MRIATRRRFLEERQAQQQLKKARLRAAATMTISRRLSYATGSEIVPVLRQHLSPRGTIHFDQRTNTLIITDIPSVIEQVVGLVRLHR